MYEHIFYEQLVTAIESLYRIILVTIISKNGSAPRGTGSQMLVGAEGRIAGTIGGGTVEKICEQVAKELLCEHRSALRHFQLDTDGVEGTGMVCGGNVSVWFQFIDSPTLEWRTFSEKLRILLCKKRGGWIIQHLNGDIPDLLDESRTVQFGSHSLQFETILSNSCFQMGDHFIMPLPIKDRAVIFGGGHCAQALLPVLDYLGFRATIMDNRPEYACRERFPLAEEVICGDYQNISEVLTLSPSDYVIVMTSEHSFDFEVLQQVLHQPTVYVGAIGSLSKKSFVNQQLRESGISEHIIEKVHTPIGIPIKAATPEEIAVSIAGEMIYVRALQREHINAYKKNKVDLHARNMNSALRCDYEAIYG